MGYARPGRCWRGGIMLVAMSGDGKDRGPVRRPRAIERPQVPPGPLADLKALIYQLYLQAGPPKLDEMADWIAADDMLAAAPGRDTISRIIRDTGLPTSQADVVAVVTVLARTARWDPDDAARRARDLWVAAQMDAARSPAAGVRMGAADPGARLNKADGTDTHGTAGAGADNQAAAPPGAVQSASASPAPSATPANTAPPQPIAAPAQTPPSNTPATIDMEVHITLDGTISESAQRSIRESITEQAAAFTDKLREVERSERAYGAKQAEFTASTVIKTNEELKRETGDSQSGLFDIILALLVPIASGAAGVSGSYLHSVWQAIVFGATATTAVIATVLTVLMPRIRSR